MSKDGKYIENGTIGTFSQSGKYPITTADVYIEFPGASGEYLQGIETVAIDTEKKVLYIQGDWLTRRVLENNNYEFHLQHGNFSRKLQFSKLSHAAGNTAIIFPKKFDEKIFLEFIGLSGLPSAIGKAVFSPKPQNFNTPNTFSHDLITRKFTDAFTGSVTLSWINDSDVIKNIVRWRAIPTIRRESSIQYVIESGGNYTSFPNLSVQSSWGTGEKISFQGKVLSIEVVSGGNFGGTPSLSVFYPGGTGASLTPVMSSGAISSVTVNDEGTGYDGFSTVIINGGDMILAPDLRVHLTAINVKRDSNGYDYFKPPTVIMSGGTGSGASVSTSVTIINEGGVDSILIVSPGEGYIDKTPITFSGNNSARGHINCLNGKIMSGTITNYGYGYTSSPVATITGGTGGAIEAIVSLYSDWKYVEVDSALASCTINGLDKNTEYEWQLYSGKKKKENLNNFSSSLKFKFL